VNTNARYNQALNLLAHGDFENGWREYELRRQCTLREFIRVVRDFPQPLWLGEEPIKGKRLLLYNEGGLGDTLQFCRYAALAAAQGATVLLEVQPPLVRLLRDLAGVAQLIPAGDPLPPFDYQCPLMSLPLAFKTMLDTIPAAPYLRSDPARVEAWHWRLGVRRRPRVGIVWSGSTNKTIHHRSIPLTEFVANLPPRRFDYFSLQRNVRDGDKRILRSSSPYIAAFDDALLDFADTAALCACMDVVVSVDTSLAHLSGALGRPTWVLLPIVPDWRWMLDRDDSPWYPTMKLYRQTSRDRWSDVFARVAADLQPLRLA
jgi:hypothetical protein